jgi:LacI family transcriptional regulator
MAPHLDRAAISRALPPASRAVLINAPANVRSHSNIRIDNRAGVRAVVEHLKAVGRRRILYVGGPSHNLDAQERAAAFASASAQSERILARGDFSVESGRDAVRRLVEGGDRFDAVFAANDMMAIGALRALRAAGVRVPEDVAVAGFDDVPLAEHLELTTVRVRIAELGARALTQLIIMLENGATEPLSELHSPELVVRQSTVPSR